MKKIRECKLDKQTNREKVILHKKKKMNKKNETKKIKEDKEEEEERVSETNRKID